MQLSLHLDFTLWNFTVGTHPYCSLGMMPIALPHKVQPLLLPQTAPATSEIDGNNSSHHLLSTVLVRVFQRNRKEKERHSF